MGNILDAYLEYLHREPFSLEACAVALGGEASGDNEVMAPSPGLGPEDRSLVVRFGQDGRPFVYDCEGPQGRAYAHLKARLDGLVAFEPDPEKAAENRARALAIWGEAVPIKGTPAERYLRERRRILDLPPDPDAVLRYHPRCPWERNREPCLVALWRDCLTDEPRAIHRIPAYPRGPKVERLTLGSITGAAIKLWPVAGPLLVVGEGIETTLAASLHLPYREPLQPAWALGSAGGIRRLPVLPSVERLVILVDNDEKGHGERAATECYRRWIGAGRKVIPLKPKNKGEDFNDVIKRVQ